MDKKQKEFKGEKLGRKNKMANEISDFIGLAFLSVIGFILVGTGLRTLYEANGELGSIIGGFALIGIALAIIKTFIEK